MKLTEKRLKEIIKEEIAKLQEADDDGGYEDSATATRKAVQRNTRALSDKLATRKAGTAYHDKREAGLQDRVSTKRDSGFPLDIKGEVWFSDIRPIVDPDARYPGKGVPKPVIYNPDHKPVFPKGIEISAKEFFEQHALLGTWPFRDVSLDFVKVLLANAKTHREELQAVINQYSQGEE